MRIIGDVHQKFDKLYPLLRPNTVQLGDLGFIYPDLKDFRFIPGNHDNYSLLPEYSLGNYGFTKFGMEFFFIRGGFSIDRKWRRIGIDWWPQEELSQEQGEACLSLYKDVKPDLVLSHECPYELLPLFLKPYNLRDFGFEQEYLITRTGTLLQRCWEYHKPKLWIFGHYHTSVEINLDTRFICLNELEHIDLR